jgi:predicted RNA-binding protein YlxR (DUF448 family)
LAAETPKPAKAKMRNPLQTETHQPPQAGTPRMQRPNNQPQRTCVGCMQRDGKEHLLRIALSGETLTFDEAGRLPGRGAYLHRDNRCITSFGRNKARALRSLKRKISPGERRKVAELIYARLASHAAHE